MAFALRLFRDEFPEDHDWSRATLREIFDGWFVPHVLRDPLHRDRPAADSTLAVYRGAISWWEAMTGNPRAGEITDEDLRRFITGLDAATYRRGPGARERKLSPASRAKHVQQIRTLLDRLHDSGPKPHLPLLDFRPPLRRRKIEHTPKPTPEFAVFRQIFDHLKSAVKLRLCAPQGVEPVYYWRALLATLYCHGWRLSTALALRWEWFAPGQVHLLRLPADANFKTHKAAIRPVPDWLLEHWKRQNLRFRTGEWPIASQGAIFGEPHPPARSLARSWARLQLAARPQAKPFSLQSLRRLHGAALRDTGFEIAARLAQEGLQHSSRHITESHYTGILERAILQLPAV